MTRQTNPAHRPILLVDDDHDMLAALRRCLRLHFDAHIADGGKMALQMIGSGTPYVAVIADVYMPAINGIELLQQIAELAPYTKRIALTGSFDTEVRRRAERAGVFRFLTKPCSAHRILAVLEEATQQYTVSLANSASPIEIGPRLNSSTSNAPIETNGNGADSSPIKSVLSPISIPGESRYLTRRA